VAGDLRDSFLLERPKLTPELRFNGFTYITFVTNFRLNLVRLEKSLGLRQTSPRHSDVLSEFLPARNHTRLVICRKPHDLSLVELGVLKCCQPQ